MFKKSLIALLSATALLAASCGGGGGGDSAPAPLTAPTLPANPATVEGETITIAWTALENASQYNIYRGTEADVSTTGTPALVVDAPATSATVTGTLGERAYFKLAAVDSGSRVGTASAEFSVTPMARPVNFTATTVGRAINLTWDASAGADSYEFFTGSAAGVSLDGPAAVTATATSAAFEGELGVPTVIVGRARNAGGTSEASVEVTVTPVDRPTGLVATTVGETVNLTWTPSAGATSYEFFSGTAAGVGLDGTPTVTSTSNSASINGSFGTTVFVVGRARNITGVSTASDEISATLVMPLTPPAAPTGLAVTIDKKNFMLSWSAPKTAVTYNIYSSAAANVSVVPGNLVQAGVSGTNATVAGDYDQTRFFVVTATNVAGTGPASNEVSGTTPPAPPQAPSNLTVQVQGVNFRLNWNPVSDATSYRIYAANSAGVALSAANRVASNVTSTTTTVPGGVPDQERFFIVTANNNNGESLASNEVSGTATIPETFLLYKGDTGTENNLILIDPRNPFSSIQVDSDFEFDENFRGDNEPFKGPVGDLSDVAFKGFYNAETGAIIGLHQSRIYYRVNQAICAVDLTIQRANDGTAIEPTPQTLATLSDHITEVKVFSDIGGDLNGVVAVQTNRGQSNEEWAWFQDNGSAAALLPLPGEPKIDIVDPANASFRGILAHDLNESDGLFEVYPGSAPTRLALPGGDIDQTINAVRDDEGTIYFLSDDRTHLISYVQGTGSASATLTEVLDFPIGVSSSECILRVAGKRAFVVRAIDATSIVQIYSATKSRDIANLVPIHTESDATGDTFGTAILPTANRVMYQYATNSGFVVRSVARDGSDPQLVTTEAFTLCDDAVTAGESLIFNDINNDRASVIETNGTNPTNVNTGRWALTAHSNTSTLAYGSARGIEGLLMTLGEDANSGFRVFTAANPRVQTTSINPISLTDTFFDGIEASYQSTTLASVKDDEDTPAGVLFYNGQAFQLISMDQNAELLEYTYN